MASGQTVAIDREEYKALLQRTEDLEDALAALAADNGVRVPHQVALELMEGAAPIPAFRRYRRLTLKSLSEKTGLALSYLSEIERGRKSGSASALARIARALDTTIDVLLADYGNVAD